MSGVSAILRGEDCLVAFFSGHSRSHCPTVFPLTPASGIERVTGRLRFPERTLELPSALVAQLAASADPAEAVPVVGLLAHEVSRRAAAVGPFADVREAIEWWDKPFNRLARDVNIVFAVVPIGEMPGGVSGSVG